MPTDEMYKKFDEAAERYLAAFGEPPSRMMMPYQQLPAKNYITI